MGPFSGLLLKAQETHIFTLTSRSSRTSTLTMSDVEGDDAPMAAAAAAAAAAPMDIQKAIQEVLKEALIHDGLARGLRETTKALDKRQAIACILAENCDEENYKKLIKALCMEHEIPLITVDDGQKLGEWADLCKIDKEGEARKIVRCSCVVIKDWGKPSQAQEYLEDHIKREKAPAAAAMLPPIVISLNQKKPRGSQV